MRRFPLALFATLVLLATSGSALAEGEDAGNRSQFLLQIGAVHAQTLDKGAPLHSELQPSTGNMLLGISDSFDSPGTRISVGNADTALVSLAYLINDHFALKFEGGVPPVFKIYGSGTVAPTGLTGALFNVNLGAPQNNPLGSVREWSPVVLLQYFALPDYAINPFFGVGFTYTFFTDVRLSSGFQESLNSQFGSTLALNAGKPGATNVSAQASPCFAPVFNVGATLRLSQHWSVSASASYILLHTTARVDINAADGSNLARSTSYLDLSTLGTSLLVNYRFSLPSLW